MQFVYHKDSSLPSIDIEGKDYNHIFKSRRTKKQDFIYTRNLKDKYLYKYIIKDINKKSATLVLDSKTISRTTPKKILDIVWCVIDPKEIQKTIPQLNEIGVKSITFIYSILMPV